MAAVIITTAKRELIPYAAEHGNAQAAYFLGNKSFEGKNYVEAANWFRRAADQGVAQAQFNLALMYLDGTGVRRDLAEAMKWFQEAANQGLPLAQNNLSAIYHQGLGVPQDDKEAFKWENLAASHGLAIAQLGLGGMYHNGIGTSRDDIEAYKWISLAAAQGDKEASIVRQEIEKSMTPEQLAEAKHRASEWKSVPETEAQAPSQ
jgi:TPR repeat protein